MSEEKHTPRRKRWFKCWCFWIPAALTVMLIAGAMLLFSPHPRYPVPELQPEDWSFQARLLMREIPRLYQAKPGEIATIRLSPADVNALLRFSANGSNLMALFGKGANGVPNQYQPFNDFSAEYRNGEFIVAYAYPLASPVLFGGHIELRMRGKIEYRDSHPRIIPSAANAGVYPVSKELIGAIFREQLDRQSERREMQIFRDVVKSITQEPDHSIKIAYSPFTLRKLLMKE